MAEPVRRRRRVRLVTPRPGTPNTGSSGETAPGSFDASGTAAQTAAVSDEGPPVREPSSAPDPDLTQVERGLRGLVGGGSSQVTPAAALRARDAARPTAEDLARAQTELTIVRRNWTPDSTLSRRS